jgi:hypothetical protein
MILTNPIGLLALLGLPAVLLIHFLQRQARVVPVSTLFLLEQTQREATSGRRFDRLTNSVPLWLQLLIVLLVTWLLVEPRYPKATSTQQVAIVVDSSASMSVFRERLLTLVEKELPRLKGPAASLQIYIFPSDPQIPAIYTGNEPAEALAELREWQPVGGAIEPTAALRLARSRIRSEGLLIYATDKIREDSLPFDAQLLAVGKKTSNIGFTGMSFEDNGEIWQATVRNYSDLEATTRWRAIFPDGSETEERELTFSPNGLRTVTGSIPDGVQSLTLRLSGDAFGLDDVLPMVVPEPKRLIMTSTLSPKFSDFEDRFRAFFPNLEKATTDSADTDLTLAAYDPLAPELPATNAIVTIAESAPSRQFLSGELVAESHSLIAGLNWQSLQARQTVSFPTLASDKVLLWQGQRPLIVLREVEPSSEADAQQNSQALSYLIFNFDLTLSNALKLPSTVILLHRYATALREQKIAFEARNTENHQLLDLARETSQPLRLQMSGINPQEEVTESVVPASAELRAPARPRHFQVRQGEKLLLSSASHFADTREADLRGTASDNQLNPDVAKAIDRTTSEDHLWPLWVILILSALLAAWHFTRQRPRHEGEASSLEPASSASATPKSYTTERV